MDLGLGVDRLFEQAVQVVYVHLDLLSLDVVRQFSPLSHKKRTMYRRSYRVRMRL